MKEDRSRNVLAVQVFYDTDNNSNPGTVELELNT